MHVSLDSALGRQRRLNSVGESITQIAPDPAAAYSLRSLTGGDPTVVRVRRGSDNHEQDFTASEVSAGALTSFVNAQVVAPLDIQALEANGRTGDFLIAKAAYSLRSLGTRQATLAATGDTVARADGKFVAQVRRNVNGDVKSFTADEVTDGTLLSFVNESFTSSLPLDVAGSAAAAYGLRNLSSSYSGNVVEVRRSSDDTTQNFKAAEITDGTLRNFCLNDDADIISFADAGLAGSPAANKRMYFDGANDRVESNTTIDESSDFFVKTNVVWFGNRDEVIFTDRGSSERLVNVQVHSVSDKVRVQVQTSTGFSVPITSTADLPKFKVVEVMLQHTASTKTLELFFDGVSQGSGNYTGTSTPANRSTVEIGSENNGSRPFTGIISDFNYNNETIQLGYGNTNADWEDTVGSNNGTVAGSPALFTGQGFDGFVKTWYDQSGNSNNATQATAANQPKIVSAGALVTGGINFNTTVSNQWLNTASNNVQGVDASTGAFTAFGVLSFDTSLSTIIPFSHDNTARVAQLIRTSGSGVIETMELGNPISATTDQGPAFTSGEKLLATSLSTGNSGTLEAFKNGTGNGSTSITVPQQTAPDYLVIGARIITGASSALDGNIEELILYPSDQSDKRRAIEESIATANGITLGSFSRDGFVKTWYDQSVTNEAGDTATGNHATQATDASQPKIVDGGTLNADGIKFDGTDDFFDAVVDGFGSSNACSVFTAQYQATKSILGDTNNRRLIFGLSASQFYLSDLQINETYTGVTAGETSLFSAIHNGTSSVPNVSIHANGNAGTTSSGNQGSLMASNPISYIGKNTTSGANFYNQSVQEIIIYESDQTDNRTAIEANIGEAYSIDLPSGVDPGFDQVDGFVETWYDQSGNGNDATQATAGSQPKIVSAGALVTGGLDFDGTDDVLETSVVPPNAATLIGVVNFDVLGINQILVGARDSTNQRSFLGRLNSNVSVLGNANGTLTGGSISSGADFLLFGVHDVGVRLISTNGTVVSNTSGAASNNTTHGYSIGANNSVGTKGSFVNGKVAEVIIYNSDQSANRPALETNIASEYGITLS